MSQDREQILKMIQDGQISVEEAVQLLEAMDETDLPDETLMTEELETPSADIPNPSGWWIFPAAAGSIVMAIGAPLMALGLIGRAAVFWAICCGWIPFFIGLIILALGVWSRTARWFHLRITNTNTGKRTFALSLPLPLSLTAWILRMARPYVPQLDKTGVDEAILALRDGLSEGDEQPLCIDVQDDKDGERVLIYIG